MNFAARQATPRAARTTLTVEARYRGKGTDLSKVPAFKRHEKDCGSPEVQIASITARVSQLSAHLKVNPKDYATQRGLGQLIGKRAGLLQYLERIDRETYVKIAKELGLRSGATSSK